MQTLEAINTRRSIRRYQDKKISEDIINELLSYAMSAPSAHNNQPWHFVVIDDKDKLIKIPTFSEYAQMCKEAPLAILVCADKKIENIEEYCIADCAAATQNLLLAIHEKGLGAVWTGIYPREEKVRGFQDLINLPSHIMPVALIVIGYPAEKPKQKDNFKKARIHHNTW